MDNDGEMNNDAEVVIETLDDYLCWAEWLFTQNDLVYGHGTDNAWDEAVAIARHVLQLPPNVGQEVLTRLLTATETEIMQGLTHDRVTSRKPLPYLLHEAWFAQEKYYIDERVIVPRSPFAELIHNEFKPWVLEPIHTILDLATGSGCIAIACAKQFPQAKVDAVDISSAALEVANINIKQHACSDRVSAICSDLFTKLENKQYDLIVSNPPYVPQNEAATLPPEYMHEPKLALFSGVDGLDCTKKILASAANFLTEKGSLFIEVGVIWEELQNQYPKVPFTWIEFAQGGEGVLVFTKAELLKYQEYLKYDKNI